MAEFMPPDGDGITSVTPGSPLGRVLKVSETTEIKGQFGLGQSGGTGKKLKNIYFTDEHLLQTINNLKKT